MRNVDDLFGTTGQPAKESGSTKSRSGTKRRPAKRRKSSGDEKARSRLVALKSDKPSEGQVPSDDTSKKRATAASKRPESSAKPSPDDELSSLLGAKLDEPMAMSPGQAIETVKRLGTTPYTDMTKLEKTEFNTALEVLRIERETRYNEAHPQRAEAQVKWLREHGREAEADEIEARKKKVTTTDVILKKEGIRPTGGRKSESAPSPTAKLGAATRLPPGQIPKNQQAPNRRIDYLAEVEATGRTLTALLLDSEFTTNDKLSLAALRNKRIKDIQPGKRTAEQNAEMEQAQKLLGGPTRPEKWETPSKEPLPSAAKGLQEAPPKKKAFDFDSLVDTDALFDDTGEESELPPALQDTPTWRANPAQVIIHEAFGPEPEGYEQWRTTHLKMDNITEKKDKQSFRASVPTFDPFDDRYLPRYRFEREVIGDREQKGADLRNEATRAELISVGKRMKEIAENGPLSGHEAASGGQRLPKGQKKKSASGQGEKAAETIAVAGEDDGPETDDVLALLPEKQSDKLTEEAWDYAMAEALEVNESHQRELDYSPTYRAMLAEMRHSLKTNTPPLVTDSREDLLWRYVLSPDMDEKSIERRAVAVGKVKAYFTKHTRNAEGRLLPGILTGDAASHYRIILAALGLGRCIEQYAKHWRGNGGVTDPQLLEQCKHATINYIEAHKDVGYPEPSYIEYRDIIAKLGRKEGYRLTPEELAAI